MRFAKQLIILGLLLVLVASFASASKVSIHETNSTSNQIYFDQVASYQITIENTESEEHVYSWSVNPLEWIIDSKTSVLVPPESKKTVELLIRPRISNFGGHGSYTLPLTVKRSDGGETIETQFRLFVKNINELIYSYRPSVALALSLPDEVDPREKFSVRITARNRNILDIESLKLELTSEHFTREVEFPLAPLEEKTFRYQFELDPLLMPGTYDLDAVLIYNGNMTISQVDELFTVQPYSVIDRDTTESTNFFKKVRVTTITNNGNVPKVVATDLKVPFYKALFSDVDVEADEFEQLKRGSWDVVLGPADVATITLKENYRPLFYILILAVILVVAYFATRSPITLKKQIIVTGKDEEGVSEMKVRIYLKNRTDKAFYNVRVLDKAPSIAIVHPSGGLGVIDPTKIVKTEKRGTIIKWDFDSIEAYEERIVTYTIKAKLKIIGTLSLPPVRVKFENVKGVERTTQSGKAVIGTKN